jgi:hypothetical protein
MSAHRLSLALDLIKPEGWRRFEQFASTFLAGEFPNLRTVASPSGDEGRDAELFSPNGDSSVVLQFSVSENWETKITNTINKIKKNLPAARILLYVSNQEIGARADDIKRKAQRNRLYLDVRDKSYFVERFQADVLTERAAEDLAAEIVDPYLAERGIIENKASALTSAEARTALVFIALQWEDDTRDKGLTKIAFEALARSALRNTSADRRLARDKVHEVVHAMLPHADATEVSKYLDQALQHLTKKHLHYYPKSDEFCLTHEEAVANRERLAALEVQDAQFFKQVKIEVERSIESRQGKKGVALDSLAPRVRRVLENFLLSRGELFAGSLASGQTRFQGIEELRNIVIMDISKNPPGKNEDVGAITDVTVGSAEALVMSASQQVQTYLRWLSDSYTLFAFLRHSPDVQSTVRKMFSHGEVWFDTSMVLPLFGEEMLDEPDRRFTRMVKAGRAAGLKLRVTNGVVEEIERHMNRAKLCAHDFAGQWKGGIPFLFEYYISKGGARSAFDSWLMQFRGKERPEDDIAEYLFEEFDIERRDLLDEQRSAPDELRIAVKEIWTEIHEKRREKVGFDPMLVLRLAEHDAENYIGVIQRRSAEQTTALGYSSWWVTLDHLAFEVRDRLAVRLGKKPPASPVMSADFLMGYLSIGPMRGLVGKDVEAAFPLSVDAGLIQHLTPELLAQADRIRDESKGDPERTIRRKVRDSLDEARRRVGPISASGLKILFES